jgi:hypothetical protein
MDEIKEAIVNLKIDSKILRTLIDTILDSCCLDYMETDLSIRNDGKILAIVKTFYPDEYENRLKGLKELKEKKDKEEEPVNG